jgi:preprotein translocase subunit SecE
MLRKVKQRLGIDIMTSNGFVGKAQEYVTESVDELKKVTKPTFAEAKQATIVTVLLVVAVAIIISIFDLAFSQLMKVFIY